MGLGRRGVALPAGHRSEPRIFARAALVRDRLLALLGRFDEALAEIRMARHLDPLSPILVDGCGYVKMMQRDYAGAQEEYDHLLQLDPMFYRRL